MIATELHAGKLTFQQSTRHFVGFQRIFGLVTFDYPSPSFRNSWKSIFTVILNFAAVICLYVLISSVEIIQVKSKVFQMFFILMIHSELFDVAFYLVINFAVRKVYHKVLISFENFDDLFVKFSYNRDELTKLNRKVKTILTCSWILKFFYFLAFTFRSSFDFIISVYLLTLFRLPEEQFILFAFHLLERFKLLRSSTEGFNSPSTKILLQKLMDIKGLINDCFCTQLMIAFSSYFFLNVLTNFSILVSYFEENQEIKEQVSHFLAAEIYNIMTIMTIAALNSLILREVIY